MHTGLCINGQLNIEMQGKHLQPKQYEKQHCKPQQGQGSGVRDLPTQNYPTRSPAQKTNDRPVMTKSKDKYQDDCDNIS